MDSAYKWQIHGHIWQGKKRWCDFVSYCPEMPENKQLHIFRVMRDEEIIKRLELRIGEFLKEVEKNIKLISK